MVQVKAKYFDSWSFCLRDRLEFRISLKWSGKPDTWYPFSTLCNTLPMGTKVCLQSYGDAPCYNSMSWLEQKTIPKRICQQNGKEHVCTLIANCNTLVNQIKGDVHIYSNAHRVLKQLQLHKQDHPKSVLIFCQLDPIQQFNSFHAVDKNSDLVAAELQRAWSKYRSEGNIFVRSFHTDVARQA